MLIFVKILIAKNTAGRLLKSNNIVANVFIIGIIGNAYSYNIHLSLSVLFSSFEFPLVVTCIKKRG